MIGSLGRSEGRDLTVEDVAKKIEGFESLIWRLISDGVEIGFVGEMTTPRERRE